MTRRQTPNKIHAPRILSRAIFVWNLAISPPLTYSLPGFRVHRKQRYISGGWQVVTSPNQWVKYSTHYFN